MYCGVDEAGRGSVMGPLVVGAVLVESDDALLDIGVKDSKKLVPVSTEFFHTCSKLFRCVVFFDHSKSFFFVDCLAVCFEFLFNRHFYIAKYKYQSL